MNLDELERTVLQSARRAVEPPPQAAAAAHAAVLARVAVAPSIPSPTTGLHLAPGMATVAAAALVGAGFVAGWSARAPSPSPAHAPVAIVAPAASSVRLDPVPEPPEARAPDSDAVVEPTREPRIRARAPVPSPAPAAASAPASTLGAPAPAASTLLEEARLLQKTERALRRGDAAAALYALEELDRKVPRGQLGQEREAARVLAACLWDANTVARAAARSYLLQHPASAYAARIREACAIGDEGSRAE